VVNCNVQPEYARFLEEFWRRLASDWNIIKFHSTVIVADGNLGFNATFVGSGQAHGGEENGVVDRAR